MIMWSMLGKRPLDVLAWESFGKDWVKDVVDQLKIKEAKVHLADYGHIVNLNDLNSNALPLGSLIKSVACSPGLPLNLM